MNALCRRITAFRRADDGPTATEYAVLLALIAGGVIAALSMFGEHMDALYLSLATTLEVF
ncbi:MAG: Flp family type IVb pilin [Phycisphaerae bacterium]|jgi:Flp pilus assembly pilin Flp